MKYKLSKPTNEINITIDLPASKSVSNRLLMLNSIFNNKFKLENISDCDDTRAMQHALTISDETIDIGAAGTAMRFLTAYFATQPNKVKILTGSARMKQRPIKALVDALKLLDAQIEYVEKEGYPPIKIYGKQLVGGEIEIDGGISSQYISALIMIAPLTSKGLTIRLKGNVISKPYIDMTLKMMQKFDVGFEWNENRILIKPVSTFRDENINKKELVVESDWSAASYWFEIVAMAQNASVSLKVLQADDSQGDKIVTQLFKQLAVGHQYTADGLLLTKQKFRADFFEADFTDCPDLAQTFVVTLAAKNIPFRISGLQSLKIKETNRIAALQNELAKFGLQIFETQENVLEYHVQNFNELDFSKSITVETYEDHRMAMAFAPLSLLFENVVINHPEVVSKSYPQFWNDLKSAGVNFDKIQ